ncbi:hypothetical protein MLD38_020292 [Melastoma candidum]|uniref:Uncharacterized protein n=1 Tax=Melastoma candidum TaxID=119954 RepID=A0ACB9QKH7_9MYRT|nr:hypothetical protein MLD38_020292 [Melastoma candidum]
MSSYNVTDGGDGGNNFGGFGFGIGISVGILLLITAMTLVTYYCTRVMQPAVPGARVGTALVAVRDVRGTMGRGEHVVDIGMDDATIQSLFPKLVYSEVSVDKGDPTTASCCTICLADYKATDTLRLLPDCGHLFHLKCVDPWLRMNPTCPVCRSSPVPTPLSTPLAEVVPLAARRD